MTRGIGAGLALAAAVLAAAAGAAPAPPPSLAKINALLDQARDHERKGTWAPVPALYAQAVAACGDPVPQHLKQVVVRALVKSGHASLALGKLPEAHAAYRDAVARFEKDYARDVRPWVLQARTLAARVEELRRMAGDPAAAAPPPPPPAGAKREAEPLVLITDKAAAKSGTQDTTVGSQGFVVETFSGTEDALIRAAESKASPNGRKILVTGREMSVVRPEILPGSCWDWCHFVFNRAGFGLEKGRQTVAKTDRKGPYVDPSKFQPGDWLYYRNRSYGNGEHSGIFVGWINGPAKVALVLSYPGQMRQEPGRYRPYELTGVFRILRPA